MPQLKGTKTHTYPLSYDGIFESSTFFGSLVKTNKENKTRRMRALYRICSRIAADILDHDYYFVGFYDYEFLDSYGEDKGARRTIRYEFITLNRHFHAALTNDERDYWRRAFTERMVYELACHLGAEEYFMYGTPWKGIRG